MWLVKFFKVVFPTLPVIPTICATDFCLFAIANFFKWDNVFFTLITLLLGTLFKNSLIITFFAPFFIASLTNLWPLFFFPLIAKNKLFFLIFLVLIETPL